jgi:hypothetical protein
LPKHFAAEFEPAEKQVSRDYQQTFELLGDAPLDSYWHAQLRSLTVAGTIGDVDVPDWQGTLHGTPQNGVGESVR